MDAPPTTKAMALEVEVLHLNTFQVCTLLKVSRGTWTAWVSKGLAPKKDYTFGGTPLWLLTTIIEYARNAPGGRLGYPVG